MFVAIVVACVVLLVGGAGHVYPVMVFAVGG